MALGLSMTSVHAVGGVYQEQDGLLVVEFESGETVGHWALEALLPGHTGSGYLRWDGSDHFASPGHDTFAFEFELTRAGLFAFRIRNHHDHPDPTLENDVWVRMDQGPWIKTFSSVKDDWTWATNHELPDGTKPPAQYELEQGRHRIEFSGRSFGFRMDRFHLYTPGHPGGQDESQPESPCVAENRPPVALLLITPAILGPEENGGTTVTLDASRSFDPDAGQSLTYRWRVTGAKFVEGTSAASQVARVQWEQGGRALAVALEVADDSAEHLTDRTHAAINVLGSAATVSGEPAAWHPLELRFHGPFTHEDANDPNPFLDYRLVVTFVGPSGQRYVVPGFFAGNGEGQGTGDAWKVRFAADEGGVWTWRAAFREGPQLAISADPTAGTPLAFDGAQGSLEVFGPNPRSEGFYGRGRLDYVGEHYLRFGDGSYFLKGGTDSPENFLGYRGFDDIQDNGGIGIVHTYQPHESDWMPGDPFFLSNTTNVSSKGIIGALNYLSQEGVNSIYFLPMNLGGDGQETCPFVGYTTSDHDRTHYDVSRLHQWVQVLDHAQRKGILLHVVLAETETANENWLDDGALGVQRKLFMRELIARFAHAPALKWNLSEENDFPVSQLQAMAAWIAELDPYDHPLGVHTHPNDFSDYEQLLGQAHFTSTSIQYKSSLAGQFVEEWRAKSAQAGRKWVIDMDENGTASTGLDDKNADELRKEVLYDVYFSGGQVEWYAGYHNLPLGGDVKLENFRTRQDMWRFMHIARRFMQDHLPFWEMQPADALLTNEAAAYGGGQVLAKIGEVYAIYLPDASKSGRIDLAGTGGVYRARWFDPRTGKFEGQPSLYSGTQSWHLGSAPYAGDQDWVVLIERVVRER